MDDGGNCGGVCRDIEKIRDCYVEGIVLWGTNSLREKTYVPGSVRSELEKVSFLPEMLSLMELEDGS